MYLGTITFDKNRFDEFLNVALSLEVKEISKINVEPAKEEVLSKESEIPDVGNSSDVDAHNVEEDDARTGYHRMVETFTKSNKGAQQIVSRSVNGRCRSQ